MMQSFSLVTNSPERTARVGALLGSLVAPGDLIALTGDLGAGKTVLTKGIAAGLGIGRDPVRSPTFTLVQRYDQGRIPLVHVDAYRLGGAADLVDLDLDEVLDRRGVTVVEWATRVARALPPERLDVAIDHAGGDHRKLRVSGRGMRAQRLADGLRDKLRAGDFEVTE